MPLLTPPTDSPLTQAQLDAALALVAAELGASTLEAHSVTEGGTVGSSGLIWLSDGPATAIGTLNLNGAPAAGVLRSPWCLDVSSVRGVSDWATAYAVTYTAGWAEGNLPPALQQAVLLTAEALANRPDPTLKSESEGPVSRSWDTSLPVSPMAGALLDRWRALRV